MIPEVKKRNAPSVQNVKKSEVTEGKSSKAKEQQREEIEQGWLSLLEASGKPESAEEIESEQEVE